MIARIWRCWTTPDADQRIVTEEVLPGIAARDLDGYHGAAGCLDLEELRG